MNANMGALHIPEFSPAEAYCASAALRSLLPQNIDNVSLVYSDTVPDILRTGVWICKGLGSLASYNGFRTEGKKHPQKLSLLPLLSIEGIIAGIPSASNIESG